MRGIVKKFNAAKGYGFIRPENENEKDVFVHYTQIKGEGFKTLEEGQKVVYDAVANEKGMIAQNVEVIK